jgi:hypothetical protein
LRQGSGEATTVAIAMTGAIVPGDRRSDPGRAGR